SLVSDWSSDVCSSDLVPEVQPLGSHVNRGGYQVFAGRNPVELCERIEPFLLLIVVWKWQFEDLRLAHFVLQSFGEVELAGNQRTLGVYARSCVFQALHVVAANAEVRERIVQFP